MRLTTAYRPDLPLPSGAAPAPMADLSTSADIAGPRIKRPAGTWRFALWMACTPPTNAGA